MIRIYKVDTLGNPRIMDELQEEPLVYRQKQDPADALLACDDVTEYSVNLYLPNSFHGTLSEAHESFLTAPFCRFVTNIKRSLLPTCSSAYLGRLDSTSY